MEAVRRRELGQEDNRLFFGGAAGVQSSKPRAKINPWKTYEFCFTNNNYRDLEIASKARPKLDRPTPSRRRGPIDLPSRQSGPLNSAIVPINTFEYIISRPDGLISILSSGENQATCITLRGFPVVYRRIITPGPPLKMGILEWS